MVVTVNDLLAALDQLAPFAIAEPWDNVGLLIGNKQREIASVLVGLDPTVSLLKEVIRSGADTLITHHPVIFKPLPAIDTAEPAGQFLEKALLNKINVIACHTNFDAINPGVNDVLATALGLDHLRPLIPSTSHPVEGVGLGRIGLYQSGLWRQEFVQRLLRAIDQQTIQVAGTMPETISCVALCGGSGSDFAAVARDSGADVYISAEIKHNVARWAEDAGFCVVEGSHYGTEKPAVKLLVQRLDDFAHEHGWELTIRETETEGHPFKPVTHDTFR